MPTVFLSPSTQEYNPYIGGGNEEMYTNLVADAMEPYLTASGIQFNRNDPALRVGGSVRASNATNNDLHLAIHSNAAPTNLAGQVQGSDVYYYPGSTNAERAANIIAENMEIIYPYPELVGTVPSTQLYELNNTRAPAVLVELAYHDNEEDANWIINNIEKIGQNLALSVTQYFEVPFVFPE